MNITWHETSKQFHLYNDRISYVLYVQPNGELGQLYYGKRIHDKKDFRYVVQHQWKALTSYFDMDNAFSLELNLQEYPSFGSGDYDAEAFCLVEENGSRISNFIYQEHRIYEGKAELPGLPATYGTAKEVMTLEVTLKDAVSGALLILSYSIFDRTSVIARHAEFRNVGEQHLLLDRALSACLDLPDADYDWMQFSGSWGRERFPVIRKIGTGTIAIESRRGHSSQNANPFVILKRKETSEIQGEAIGFSFVYSGNFLAQAQKNTDGRLRIVMGIHPETFSWPLAPGESFVTPEVLIGRSEEGLSGLSRIFHHLYNDHLVRGYWQNRPRPILLNNWEATCMDFTQERILDIAKKGKEAGVELFVLDDGWFGARDDDRRGLGDWVENPKKLPQGMKGLAEKVNEMGLKFGFWIEPEMVNEDSDLYRAHPDWILSVPGRKSSLGRWQLVLDFSKPEVVEYIYDMLYRVIKDAPISYIKWDMNRSISECFSIGKDPAHQGEVYHRYILGVYDLYERLRTAFPEILFESCSSGGGRFDAGMLYYAPQAWCSDNTDGEDRCLIQYGTSFGYPISSIGAHVSAVPNQQTGRAVPIRMRGNVAMFGAFGYELDLNEISDDEFEIVKEQIAFVKEHRMLLQYGDLYRLRSPFEKAQAAWISVSGDRKEALLAVHTMRATVNHLPERLKLAGLDPECLYQLGENSYYGDELMEVGLPMKDACLPGYRIDQDDSSVVLYLKAQA
ncbi:MAG: alpha-galactosidase [Lachnospiraceae bacterium]|nr:alpha-galactosidase [Lachnospiraceae bacterium]